MFIVAVLPTLYVRRLEEALPGEIEVTKCATVADCQTTLDGSSVDCVLVDPSILDDEELEKILQIIRSRRVPVVLYTSLTADALTRMLPALKEGAVEIIISGSEDYAERLRHVLQSLPFISAGASLVSALAPELTRLAAMVRHAVTAILLDPSLTSSKDLRHYTTVGRRTIERELTRVQFAPLHRWWSVSRLLRAFTALKDGNVSPTQAARLAGYASARSLDQQCLKILQAPLAEARHALSQRQFVDFLARSLRQPAKGPNTSRSPLDKWNGAV